MSKSTTPSRPRWRVMKFGGSSVADAGNWPKIATEASKVLEDGGNAVIVVSALAGMTDLLDACLQSPGEIEPGATLAEVLRRHKSLAAAVGVDASVLEPVFERLRDALDIRCTGATPARSIGRPAGIRRTAVQPPGRAHTAGLRPRLPMAGQP